MGSDRLIERAKNLIGQMYAVITAASFALLVTLDKAEVTFRATTVYELLFHLALFCYLWIEWLWSEEYLNDAKDLSFIICFSKIIVHGLQLWCFCFCFIFCIRGKDINGSIDLSSFNTFGFWFLTYLFLVIFWGILNRKPDRHQPWFNFANICAFILFLTFWTLDFFAKLDMCTFLKKFIFVYIAVSIVFRVGYSTLLDFSDRKVP